MSRRRVTSRRGGVYLLVLSVSMVVSLTGVTALYLARVRSATARMDEQAAQAHLDALSMVEVVAHRLNSTSDWRSTTTSGAWSAWTDHDGWSSRWKATDEIDGDLANDPDQPVRLAVHVERGLAQRVLSVRLSPRRENVNLANNPSFEFGTTGWSRVSSSITTTSADATHGTRSLLVTSRSSSDGIAKQDVRSATSSDTTYRVEATVKPLEGGDDYRVAIRYVTLLLTLWTTGPWEHAPAGEWTTISAELTPSFTGSLLGSDLMIMSRSGRGDLLVDEVVLRRAGAVHTVLRPDPGTWRQEPAP